MLYIELRIYLRLVKAREGLVDKRQGITILLRKLVKLPVVYAEAQATVRFLNKEHGRRIQSLARNNKSLIEVFEQVLLNSLKLFCRLRVQQSVR